MLEVAVIGISGGGFWRNGSVSRGRRYFAGRRKKGDVEFSEQPDHVE